MLTWPIARRSVTREVHIAAVMISMCWRAPGKPTDGKAHQSSCHGIFKVVAFSIDIINRPAAGSADSIRSEPAYQREAVQWPSSNCG